MAAMASQKARTQGKMAGILEIQLQIQAGDGQIKKHCGQKGQGHMDRGQELHFSRSVRNENGNQQEKERQICQSRFPLRSQAGSSHGNGRRMRKRKKPPVRRAHRIRKNEPGLSLPATEKFDVSQLELPAARAAAAGMRNQENIAAINFLLLLGCAEGGKGYDEKNGKHKPPGGICGKDEQAPGRRGRKFF